MSRKTINNNKRIRRGVRGALMYMGETTVRLCTVKECRNNRAYMGEYECNCKEIEIVGGQCQQFTPKEK